MSFRDRYKKRKIQNPEFTYEYDGITFKARRASQEEKNLLLAGSISKNGLDNTKFLPSFLKFIERHTIDFQDSKGELEFNKQTLREIFAEMDFTEMSNVVEAFSAAESAEDGEGKS